MSELRVISRALARAERLMHYFTGKPCKHGHTSRRLTSNGQCTSCAVVDAAKARKNRPEKVKANAERWRQRNREKYLDKMAKYREQNREYFRQYNREYTKENLSGFNAQWHKRRATKRTATPAWYGELDDFVMREAAHLSRLRRAATGVKWDVDHMIPLRAEVACGLHCASNIQVIPGVMNSAKRNRMMYTNPFEWVMAL